jgi:hypothetical protein
MTGDAQVGLHLLGRVAPVLVARAGLGRRIDAHRIVLGLAVAELLVGRSRRAVPREVVGHVLVADRDAHPPLALGGAGTEGRRGNDVAARGERDDHVLHGPLVGAGARTLEVVVPVPVVVEVHQDVQPNVAGEGSAVVGLEGDGAVLAGHHRKRPSQRGVVGAVALVLAEGQAEERLGAVHGGGVAAGRDRGAGVVHLAVGLAVNAPRPDRSGVAAQPVRDSGGRGVHVTHEAGGAGESADREAGHVVRADRPRRQAGGKRADDAGVRLHPFGRVTEINRRALAVVGAVHVGGVSRPGGEQGESDGERANAEQPGPHGGPPYQARRPKEWREAGRDHGRAGCGTRADESGECGSGARMRPLPGKGLAPGR